MHYLRGYADGPFEVEILRDSIYFVIRVTHRSTGRMVEGSAHEEKDALSTAWRAIAFELAGTTA